MCTTTGVTPVFLIGENMPKRAWNKLPAGITDKHPVYRAWHNMKQRCNNPKNNNYLHYGGRGVKVCESWDKFVNFYEDIGYKYSKGLSLDRIDVNGDYTHENCRWATRYEQDRNRQNSRLFDGKTLVEKALEHGFCPSTIRKRYYVMGWSIERCLNTPVDLSYSRRSYGE